MTRVREWVIGIICGFLGTSMLDAGDFSSYRGFHLGMSLTAAAKEAGTTPTEATIVHQRPALIQEMEWWPRPRCVSAGSDFPSGYGWRCRKRSSENLKSNKARGRRAPRFGEGALGEQAELPSLKHP
jgi:hypothetical protein